mmetsp:Transcript_40462/g.61722  ORF Transcript_40462/g.61722 Transcript_40462/m.61722 type:complete len:87 (-) Transcript_40462:752-1012(-)
MNCSFLFGHLLVKLEEKLIELRLLLDGVSFCVVNLNGCPAANCQAEDYLECEDRNYRDGVLIQMEPSLQVLQRRFSQGHGRALNLS